MCRGRTLVFGLDARYTPIPDLATRVGFLFQDPEAQLFQVRVDDEVAFALENLGLPEKEISHRVGEALEIVGLRGLEHRRPATLSGGQKQRLALAAVLAMRPPLLVLDEPTANLDPVGRNDLLRVLPDILSREHTLWLATQEIDWAVSLATRVHVLEAGNLICEDAPSVLFSRAPDLAGAGIPIPQVTQAARQLQMYGIESPPVLTPEEALPAWRRLLSEPARRRPAHRPPNPPSNAQEAGRGPRREWPQAVPVRATVDDLHFTYPDGTVALRGVSLTIEPGEMVALVGANGAGKSTLARHLNGLLHPTRGHVWIGKQETGDVPVHELARHVGYAFQNPDHQIFAPTVEEEIAFGPRTLGFPPEEVSHRVQEMLTWFGLDDYRRLPPAILGMGLRRKVALASVLVSRPPIIILDEPTGGLGPASTRELMTRVEAFHRAGHTVMLITHDMRLVADWAKRVVVMADGQIIFDGTPKTLFTREDILHEARLTRPPISQMATALAPLGIPANVLSVEEFVAAFLERYNAGRTA